LIAFFICLASANMSFGILAIPLHYRISIHGANPIGVLGSTRSAHSRKIVANLYLWGNSWGQIFTFVIFNPGAN
jgi:hypothetical protein